jgi:hypothetical protein
MTDYSDTELDIEGALARLNATANRIADERNTFLAEVKRLRSENGNLRAALERIAESRDAGRHDGLREECPLHDQYTMWLDARCALGEAKDE